MTLRSRTAATAPTAPADLEHFQHYVAALAARLPAILDAHVADRQMLLHLLDEQVAYLHARRGHLYAVEWQDRLYAQQWCVLTFHLKALQKHLGAQTPPASPARYDQTCTCDLAYHPTLAHSHPLDVYIPLNATTEACSA